MGGLDASSGRAARPISFQATADTRHCEHGEAIQSWIAASLLSSQ
jgi:hypothetical protein